MQFRVSRTSVWDKQPCDEAIKMTYTRVDERVFDSPTKFQRDMEVEWFEKGKNHRVENGHIKRDFEDVDWFIEINTIEELLDFKNKYGELVLNDMFGVESIEIYDDYRE